MEEILKLIKQLTEDVNVQDNYELFTAESLADNLGVKRNTVSNWCNRLVERGLLIKIQGRPVYFLHFEAFCKRFFIPSKQFFNSIEDLFGEEAGSVESYKEPKKDVFSDVIGNNGSLRKAIEQMKISLFYPSNRLPIILIGSTGVGKTYLATLMHKFAIENKIITGEAPFISFNCAQYAENPELLASNLFGYVKGAFTGAYTDTEGLLEVADGGILFLDEVHRISKEGQEKLFTFMDQGVFRRVGESDGWHKVNVRLIMATTENLSTSFLETFLRRIPLIIKIPSLEKRGYKEKLQLIYLFFLNESKILNHELIVSEKVLQVLISSNKSGNVGALENLVKIICGTAYSHQQSKDTIIIKLPDVPEDVLYNNNSKDKFTKELNNIRISPQMSLPELCDRGSIDKSNIDIVFHKLENVLISKDDKEKKTIDCEYKILQIVESFFSNIGCITIAEEEQGLMKYLVDSMQEVSRYIEDNYEVRFKGSSIYDIATYLYYRINESRNQRQHSEQYISLIKTLEDFCRDQIPMAKKISTIIESNIDVGLNDEDIILFSLYLKSLLMKGVKGHSRGIIIAHGNTTARSISNVVNNLLEKNLFDFIDIPVESNDEEIINFFTKFSKNKNTTKGIIILTDFILSDDVCNQIGRLSDGQVLILNNISTDFALAIGRKLKAGADFQEIIEFYSINYKIPHKLIYPTNKMSKCLISCCITGIGASEPIRQMLHESLPRGVEIAVVSEDYGTLLRKGKNSPIFSSYDVLGIIGTLNPRVKDVTYISLEELILGESTDKIKDILSNIISDEELSEFQYNLFINFSLENLMRKLVVLDANKLIFDVDECINRYKDMTGIEFSNRKRMSIIFHVCCMTERLVRRIPIEILIDEEEDIILQREKQEMLIVLKRAFSIIEKNYNVNIPLCEWNNIMDIILMDYN